MNALEKCVDMLVAIVIMFLVPLLFYSAGNHILQAVSAGEVCENFLKRVSTSGEITLPVWKELEEALGRFGCEEFRVRRKYTFWEPGVESGSAVERSYFEEKVALLEQMRTEGAVGLHKGDSLRVTVYIDDIPTVYYGIVRNEGTAE